MARLHSTEAAEQQNGSSRQAQDTLANHAMAAFADLPHDAANRTLREQSHLLDMIFKHSIDSIAILDKDYNFIRVNASYARACQRPVDEFPGKNHFALYPSELQQELEPYRAQKKLYSRAARPFVFPDHPEWGITYWDIAIVPILHSDGEIEYFLLTLKDVTGSVRAEERNQDYIRRLRNLSMRLVTLQESERAALARELHDEIGQNLTAVKIRLQAMQPVIDRELMPGLHSAVSTVSQILDQVRGLSLDLRPMQLDDLGLRIALTSLIERVAATAGWDVQLDLSIPPGQFDRDVELACFRVAQEALTNVMRHAAASRIWITLRHDAAALHLMVRDNGRGFDTSQPKSGPGVTHFGLFSMEERVRNLRGQFEVSSSRGGGTVVRASFPLARPLGTSL